MARSRRAERRVAALLVAGLAAAALAAEDPSPDPEDDRRPLAFERHGELVASRDLSALRRAVAPSAVRVFEPYEQSEVTFRALPFDRVLDAVYGPTWRAEQELLLRCRDGYEPTIPVQRAKDHHAWLAFARVDRGRFSIRKRESGEWKTVELAPFYLVWENLEDAQVRQEADYGWPYQLVAIDLIRTRDRFGAMAPPDGASAAVRAGFDAFRVHCSRCHRLRGQGGNVGPELRPASIAGRDREWLRAWIEDPSSLVPNARMEALNPALPDRARVVDEIIEYLDALAQAQAG